MDGFTVGLASGLFVAAPVGPLGLLCLRRSLSHGRLCGFVSGLGIASADCLFAAVAVTGIEAVTRPLLAHRVLLETLASLFLIGMGLHMARSRPPENAPADVVPRSLIGDYFSTFGLTLANPQTILSFVGLFAALRLAAVKGPSDRPILVLGVFVGSTLWWLVLSQVSGWFREHLKDRAVRLISVVAGLAIAGFGAWTLGWIALDRALR